MEQPDIVTADETNFEFQVLAYSERVPVLVDFWAQWSDTCQRISPLLESLAKEHGGRFRLAKVNADANPQLIQRYQVHTLPSLKTFENGVVTRQMEGLKTNLQVIEYVKSIVPSQDNLLVQKAISYYAAEQYREVEETCLEILVLDPRHPKATLLLVKSLIWQREYLEALTALNRFPASTEFPQAETLIPLVKAMLAESETDHPVGEPLDPVYFRALNLIRIGNIPAALDGLLSIIKQNRVYRKNLPHQLILGLFELLGQDHPVTREYQALLANSLF